MIGMARRSRAQARPVEGRLFVLCGEPDRPRAGCGRVLYPTDDQTITRFADVEVTLCAECDNADGAPF